MRRTRAPKQARSSRAAQGSPAEPRWGARRVNTASGEGIILDTVMWHPRRGIEAGAAWFDIESAKRLLRELEGALRENQRICNGGPVARPIGD